MLDGFVGDDSAEEYSSLLVISVRFFESSILSEHIHISG